MVMSLTDISRTTNVIKENIDTGMEMCMRGHGKMTLRMGLVNYSCKMARSMRDSLLKDKNTEREFTCGRMEIDMKGSLHMTRGKGWENTTGVMEVSTRASGRQIE
jgi:hypothetical protein